MLDRWRNITNLISQRSFSEIWTRHIEDSVYIQKTSPGARRWLDLGSGAGFPAIVIAALIADYEGSQVHCVESDGRKCAFLRGVARELHIPVKVYNTRAETISPAQTGHVDVVTARAFASIEHILSIARAHISDGGVVILPRGRKSVREVKSLDANRYIIKVRSNPGRAAGLIIVIRQRVRRN